MESHGSWHKLSAARLSLNLPKSSALLEVCVLDCVKTQYEILKTRTGILFWSLGNKSHAGDILAMMNVFYKESYSNRLTHYKGVWRSPGYMDRIKMLKS
ncbi:MAG: hypothetical protein HUJ51_00805 [Eggerthellaceae bacterium]|nr:hypothetical protein [Eggerthellaceae bacterium]